MINLKADTIFDVAIIGGGLAGLALSTQCSMAGFKTILFEKERYPFHRVCGEYISLESRDFLQSLGLPLADMHLPVISRLLVTSPNGNAIQQHLDLGGIGISRHLIDYELYKLAKATGVHIEEGVKVDDIHYENNSFTIYSAMGIIQASVAAGCFGKRSNIDVKWKRKFVSAKNKGLNNYIGVKYHIKIEWPDDLIALHNFKDGYCGISKVEDGKCCFCYLTTAQNLKKNGNSIAALETNVLEANPHLKNILDNADKLFQEPVTIAQISFATKKQVENNVLMIGDAAGMITPLCGNGMSMALHGSKLAFQAIGKFLHNEINRHEMETQYSREWKIQFSKRLAMGRIIQQLFGKRWVTNLFIKLVKPFPRVIKFLVKQTHGKPF
jgi:menaquinone-9 beta-reductase